MLRATEIPFLHVIQLRNAPEPTNGHVKNMLQVHIHSIFHSVTHYTADCFPASGSGHVIH